MQKEHITIVSAILIIFMSASLSNAAMTVAVDVNFAYATEPYEGEADSIGETSGYGAGINLFIFKNFAVRVDVNSFKWERRTTHLNVSYKRTPIFIGVRYYLPLHIYAEGGIERSNDESKSTYTGPLYGIYGNGSSTGYKGSSYGISHALGLEIPLGEHFFVDTRARYHFIRNDYFTFGASVGYRF